MNLGLILYVLLLFLDGLITWQATGSALLLTLPMAGLIIYGAICGRSQWFAEIFRFLISAATVAAGAMQYGTAMFPMVINILALPHFLAATQCLWEIRRAPVLREKGSVPERITVFSLAFYASCGLAFVLLKADDLRLAWLHQQFLAGLVIVLALVGWECSRVHALRSGTTEDQPGLGARLRRAAVLLAVAFGLILIFLTTLPPIARYTAEFSPALRDRANLNLDLGPPHRPKRPEMTRDPSAQDPNAPVSIGVEETARSGRAHLPPRVRLKLSEDPRAYVKFDDPAAGKALADRNGLYVRSLGLSHYEEHQWFPLSETGYWVTDAEDGAADGHVTITPPNRPALSYTLYAPEHDGYALPVLAGVRQIDVPRLYFLSDQWYQLKETGNIKFHGISELRHWGQMPEADYKAGNIGVEYLRVPDGPLGEALTKLSREIFASHRKPGEAIDALAAFFKNHYQYSTEVVNKNGLPPLENFLFDERRGYCDLFATSAALLLRKAGIPTRMAFGYMGGMYDEKSQVWTFQQRHAHAWVEMHLQDEGWVIGEFTPRDPSALQDGKPSAPAWSDFADAGKPLPDAPPPTKLEPPSFLGQLHALVTQATSGWVPVVLGSLLAILALWAWLSHRAQTKSPEARARRALAEREQQPGYYSEFLALATQLGFPPPRGATLREVESKLRPLPLYHPDFARLTLYHYETRYEDAPLDRKLEKEFLQTCRAVRQQAIPHAEN